MAQIHAIINFLLGLWPMVKLCLDMIGYVLTSWLIIKFIKNVTLILWGLISILRHPKVLVEKLLLAPLERFVGRLAWLLLLAAGVGILMVLMPEKY